MFTRYDDQFGSLDSFNSALRAMYDFFIAPLGSHLPTVGSNLVIVPFGMMNYYPFMAALNANGHYLLDDYTLAVTPTLSVLDLVKNGDHERQHSHLLTVEHPGKAGSSKFLPNVEIETTIISTYFDEFQRLKETTATANAIIKQSPSANVVHFACHGVFDWRRPEASGLMLPDGGWLTVPDVFNRVRLPNTTLVVLSACEVGREHLRQGEEHSGLVRSFMYAGTPAVIAGLWSVSDLSTMLLMTRFYNEWLTQSDSGEQLSIAQALRKAQRWLRNASKDEIIITLQSYVQQLAALGAKTEALKLQKLMARIKKLEQTKPPFAHPYYWAAFQGIGDVL